MKNLPAAVCDWIDAQDAPRLCYATIRAIQAALDAGDTKRAFALAAAIRFPDSGLCLL